MSRNIGKPFLECGAFPPLLFLVFFSLWLAGLFIRLFVNDLCCPQQNPKIECSQGTGKRRAGPGHCHSIEELQANFDQAENE
jgi:hypothetical protein